MRVPVWLTAAEVAALLLVSVKTVYRWLEAGKLPGELTPGGHWRVRLEDVPSVLTPPGGVPRVEAPAPSSEQDEDEDAPEA